MNHRLLLLTGLLALPAAPALADHHEEAISDWPQAQKDTIAELAEKYGEADGVTDSRLIWTQTDSPWDETIVYRDAVDHDFPMPHQDYLEQSVFLEVPADKMDELSEFDGSVIVYRTEGRVAARCDKEGANFLALNLAHAIINDEMSVDEAREAYAEAVRGMMAGETPDLMSSLTFEPMSAEEAGDADVAVIEAEGRATAAAE